MSNDQNPSGDGTDRRPTVRYVSPRMRSLAKQTIDALDRGDFGKYESLFNRFYGEHYQTGEGAAALIELFDSPVPTTVIFSAGIAFQMGVLDPDAVTVEDHQSAEEVLVAAITSPWRVLACGALVGVHLSERLISAITPVLQEADEFERLGAAAALGGSGVNNEQIRHILTQGLRNEDASISFLAASALLRLGIHDKECLGIIASTVRQLHADGQFSIWMKLRAFGIRNQELADLAITVASDRLADASVRGAAAGALHVLSGRADMVTNVLGGYVRQPGTPSQLLLAAIDGLASLSQLGQMIDRMCELLDNSHASIRVAAGIGLQRLGLLAAPKVGFIAAHFAKETDVDVLHSLVRAFVQIGRAAVQSLVHIVNTADLERSKLALSALRSIGEDAVPALTQLLLQRANSRLEMYLLTALAQIGRGARSALPAVCTILEETNDAAAANSCVTAILQMGNDIAPAIPSFLDWIVYASVTDLAAKWALIALHLLRSDAIAALKVEIERRQGSARERLKGILVQLLDAGDPRFAYIESLDFDLLSDFAQITAHMKSGRVSRRALAAELKRSGVLPGAGRSSEWNPQRVVRALDKVSEKLAIQIYESDKDGTRLTDDGMRVSADAEELVRMTMARRKVLN